MKIPVLDITNPNCVTYIPETKELPKNFPTRLVEIRGKDYICEAKPKEMLVNFLRLDGTIAFQVPGFKALNLGFEGTLDLVGAKL